MAADKLAKKLASTQLVNAIRIEIAGKDDKEKAVDEKVKAWQTLHLEF